MEYEDQSIKALLNQEEEEAGGIDEAGAEEGLPKEDVGEGAEEEEGGGGGEEEGGAQEVEEEF